MFTTRPELRGTFGMVASTHWLASAAGMSVLERGGNAFDAAVATGFMLQVVEPHLNGPGGEVPARLLVGRSRRAARALRPGGRPGAATIERFHELGHELVPGHRACSRRACRARSAAGCCCSSEFGTWRLEDVLEFAIGYAEHGYPARTSGSARRSSAPRSCFASGPARATCTCRRPRSARSSGTRRSPRRTGASSTSRAAARARRRSRRRGRA